MKVKRWKGEKGNGGGGEIRKRMKWRICMFCQKQHFSEKRWVIMDLVRPEVWWKWITFVLDAFGTTICNPSAKARPNAIDGSLLITRQNVCCKIRIQAICWLPARRTQSCCRQHLLSWQMWKKVCWSQLIFCFDSGLQRTYVTDRIVKLILLTCL